MTGFDQILSEMPAYMLRVFKLQEQEIAVLFAS